MVLKILFWSSLAALVWTHVGYPVAVALVLWAYALMVGVPARRVGWMCQCGVRLQLRDDRKYELQQMIFHKPRIPEAAESCA